MGLASDLQSLFGSSGGAQTTSVQDTFILAQVPEVTPEREPEPAKDSETLFNRGQFDETEQRHRQHPLALAAHLGTLGFGVNVHYSLTEKISLGVAGDYLDFAASGRNDEFDTYSYDLSNRSVSLLASYFPRDSGFRITSGLQIGAPKFDIEATTSFLNSGVSVPMEMEGDVQASWFAGPYLGMGYTKSNTQAGLSFYSDLGFSYMGAAKKGFDLSVDCSSFGSVAAALCQVEADEFEEQVDQTSFSYFYPVARFGMAYRF